MGGPASMMHFLPSRVRVLHFLDRYTFEGLEWVMVGGIGMRGVGQGSLLHF